ncbi:TIGR04388 family protein [Leptospira interrogans serovar Australis]|uniref:TIGR04388 family protein n=1 Tax=Leptospira interrogans TaxID=173 RepID=UPI0009CB4EB6|nr:TIGR04388 family protein [Leptospira interrogans]OOC00388.1 pretoxin [Leptospira interrogans serovar Australis]
MKIGILKHIITVILLCTYSALYAPPVVVPNLNTPVFNATSMDQTFNVANGMQTVGNWDVFVFQGVSILQTQWEAQVQAQITMMVNSITTSDHYASVQEYQTYVYNSLQSKASEQLIVWQTAVEAEILQERSQYLSQKYGANSNAVQNSTSQFQSQWDSFVSGNGLNLNMNGSLSQTVLNSGQQTLEGLEGQWWNDFQNNLQSGLQTYQQALAGLTEKYQNLINQINQTELQYQAHLAQIQQSQAGTKDQILSSLEGYQSFLNSNGLFWNTMSVVYDNSTGSYAQGSCPGGHVCVTYQYDTVTSQFYTAGNCPVGHVCANVLYDNNTSSYVQAGCPGGHICDGSQRESLIIRTGLNADGRAFQNVINNVVNAMQDGFIMPAIFDYSSGTMLSYNSNCLNTGTSCIKGLYDITSNSFVAGTTCVAGHTCYSAVVDNTNPAAMTGSYFANSCTVGDSRCVTCQAGHTCQVQEMEASFLYASSLMSNFLHNELLATQGALQSAINYQNGGGASHTYTYGQGTGPYDNQALNYHTAYGGMSFNHFSGSASLTTAEVSINELFNGGFTEGAGGLGKKIIQLITGQISQTELANWIMNAYESSMIGDGSYLAGLFGPNGLGPGMTITGINQADLRAFMNEDNDPHPNGGPNQYCPDPLGCHSGDIFHPDPGIYGVNDTFSQRGYDFNRYIAREMGVWAGIPFLADIEHYQDYAWIELSFTVTNNNAYANVTTYQDLVLQLQSFEHDWMTNVMPSVTNWTAQVASYNAQYANWQTQMQTALTDAQNAYNAGVQDLQDHESSWLAQMGQLQQQAQNAFDAASNALKNGQGQSNYGQLTGQVLAGLNKGQLDSGIKPLEIRKFNSYGGDILENLDRDANRGVPNFNLLSTFGSSMSRAITGVSNLTLLSSTNNALMDNILGYMQNVAESMRNERQFSQNGQQALIDAHHLRTKTITTKDKYSGEDISTTYVLDENGNIRMFTDEDGETKQMTVGDWITSKDVCGENLTNAGCNKYTENTYENVVIDSKGNITAHRNIYNGNSSQCGADATQSGSYCYDESDRIVTIAPPDPKALLLGRGASRLGDIFNSKENGIGDLVNGSFGNLNTYFSSNKYTAGLFNEVKNAQMENDHNASIAANDVNNKVKIANLIANYAESVLYGGMKTGQWVANQSRQAIQDVVATALSNAFDLPPDAAALLSGGLVAHLEADRAKHHLESRHLGLGKHLDSIEGRAFGMVSGGVYDIGMRTAHTNDLVALNRWKEFKNSMVGFAVQKYGESQHWSPEFTGFASQYVADYFQMKQAKEELGRRSGAFSMNSMLGEIKVGLANVGGAIGEVRGALINGTAHIAGDLGLMSEGYEREINQNVRTAINDIKLKNLKDDIRTWSGDQVGLASASVKEYGKQNNWEQAKIEMWSRQASDFVVRHQAEREIHRRDNLLLGGNPALFLDRKLFSGGLTSLITKGFRGVATTLADVGNMLGEGVVSSAFRDSVYDQTRDWRNTITQEDVKARTGQGIINKAHIETEMRNQLFDVIGETFIPGDKEAAHNLGLLLKHHIDAKEEKKQAKEQRLRDAQTIVQVAAAAAAIYFSGGTASQGVIGWLNSTSTLAKGVGLTLTNGQVGAMAVSTAVSMAIEGELNGSNGAVAALANGIISTATLGVKTPVTGYVSYTKHQNANLLTGQHEVKGGWGGGFNLNLAAAGNPSIQGFMNALKMTNLSLGLSYNQDAGLGMNVNTNFTSKLGLGLDYNFKSGNYTANGSYDFDKIQGKDWANASLGISASKNGQSNLTLSYNDDGGESKIPQRLRGQGATLDFGNDGRIGLSVQGLKGATVANISYNTNTHGFEDLTLNGNFQNEFNQGLIAEHSQENLKKQQMELLKPMVGTGMKMGLYSQAEIDQALPRDGKGGIDMEKADPSVLLAKWDHYKNSMSGSEDSIKIWKEQVTRAGEEAGVKIRFNEGKSAASTFGKFVSGLVGDIAQSFGFANDGSKMVDKDGVFRLNTCFGPSEAVLTPNGYKAISSLKVRDEVITLNEDTGKLEIRRITKTFVHDVNSIHEVNYENDSKIKTTWNHPFAIQRIDRSVRVSLGGDTESSQLLTSNHSPLTSEYVKVEDLRSGDRSVTVASIRNSLVSSSVSSKKPVTSGAYLAGSKSSSNSRNPMLDWRSERRGTLGIVGVEEKFLTQKVYNIEVEGNHNYFVRAKDSAVLVHNYDQKMRDVLAKVKTSITDRIAQATDRESFDFEGSTWVRKGGEPILDKKGKVIGKQPHYYESASNQYHKNDRLYIEPTADGKDIQLRQLQREGEHYKDVKIYDKYLNWTGNVDTIGNLPHLNPSDPSSVRFHLDYTDKFANERGYHFEKDGNGKTKTHTVNVDGESRAYTKSLDGKTMLLLGYTATTQHERYYQDLTANDKKIIYDRLGTADDLDFNGICNGKAPATVMRGMGYTMTDSQVREYGSMGVMVARASQEHGSTMIDGDHLFGHKPSQMGIEILSKNSFEKFGFEIPPKGSIYNDVRKPEMPKRADGMSDERFAQSMKVYNDTLAERSQSSLDKVKPWVIEQIKKGNPVVVGGDFTGSGHVVTIVGFTPTGYIVHDSWGDANNYSKTKSSGQFVHYKYDKFSLGYGYTLRKKK